MTDSISLTTLAMPPVALLEPLKRTAPTRHIRVDAGTLTSKTTFSGIDTKQSVDASTVRSKATFSGVDHHCHIIPNLIILNAVADYLIDDEDRRSQWDVNYDLRFRVRAELSPEANPC